MKEKILESVSFLKANIYLLLVLIFFTSPFIYGFVNFVFKTKIEIFETRIEGYKSTIEKLEKENFELKNTNGSYKELIFESDEKTIDWSKIKS